MRQSPDFLAEAETEVQEFLEDVESVNPGFRQRLESAQSEASLHLQHSLSRDANSTSEVVVRSQSTNDLQKSKIDRQKSTNDQRKAKIDRQKSMSNAIDHQEPMNTRVRRRMSSVTTLSGIEGILEDVTAPQPEKGTKLIEAETVETGTVKMGIFLAYVRAVGYVLCCVVLGFFSAAQFCQVYSSVWLADWSAHSLSLNKSYFDQDEYRLSIFSTLAIAQGICLCVGYMIMASAMVAASRHLHENMFRNLLRSPLSFYDVTPIGRILNRASRDVESVDNILPASFRMWLISTVQIIGTFTVIIANLPEFAIIILPLFILYAMVQRFYVFSSRQLKRLESVSRSPIYSHFQESIAGASSIRSYRVKDRFIKQSEQLVDYNQATYFTIFMASRWLGVRLDSVGNLVGFFAAIFAIYRRDLIDASVAGLTVSYAMSVVWMFYVSVFSTTELELNIVAVERIEEYTNTPNEALWENDQKPPADWPRDGAVDFQNYAARYRPGLNLALTSVSCGIKPGEKIGIVGRTGAGKSSLTLCLFRIIEAAAGRIKIDGVDIAALGLHDLRRRLTIIPQDAFLFGGSLRGNLDPFGNTNDDALWSALEHAHLKEFVRSLPGQLDYQVSEAGEDLSVGQRQLLCLARALLRKTSILILDEATAAVDYQTDELIQKTIRREFANCTVLTIAHRLNTIIDSTRVMVLDQGRIAELEEPAKLLSNRNSIFFSMAREAGLAS